MCIQNSISRRFIFPGSRMDKWSEWTGICRRNISFVFSIQSISEPMGKFMLGSCSQWRSFALETTGYGHVPGERWFYFLWMWYCKWTGIIETAWFCFIVFYTMAGGKTKWSEGKNSHSDWHIVWMEENLAEDSRAGHRSYCRWEQGSKGLLAWK